MASGMALLLRERRCRWAALHPACAGVCYGATRLSDGCNSTGSRINPAFMSHLVVINIHRKHNKKDALERWCCGSESDADKSCAGWKGWGANPSNLSKTWSLQPVVPVSGD